MVLKVLEFLKGYVLVEVRGNVGQGGGVRDNKLARTNYERISTLVLPILTLCIDNLSP